MNNIGDVMKGGISAILIAVGYVVIWCGVICLIMAATGMEDMPQDSILWCGGACVVFSAILIGSGIAWYQIVRPKD